MAMPAAPPSSTNNAASRNAGEPVEYIRGSCAAQPAGHNVNPRNSAEQPADGKDLSGSVLRSRDAQQGKRAVPDEGGEKQPKKRCNHNLAKVDDVMMPEILQPWRAAIAQEIDKYQHECELWDPPQFGDTAAEEKTTFRLRKVYERLCSIQTRRCLSTDTPAQKRAVYVLIKGLLVALHGEADSSACRTSPKKQAAANELYDDFRKRTPALDASSLEHLALAVRQQMAANTMDRSRHVPRYLKCLADFAQLHDL